MTADRANDLRAFLDFAANLIGDGGDLTLDEALDRWERKNEGEAEIGVEWAETIQGVYQGLDDMRVGRGRPFEEFDREFRERHELPSSR